MIVIYQHSRLNTSSVPRSIKLELQHKLRRMKPEKFESLWVAQTGEGCTVELTWELWGSINGESKVVHEFGYFPDREVYLERFPRLVAHVICESLGYHTPDSAANVVGCYVRQVPCFCEYHDHLVGGLYRLSENQQKVAALKEVDDQDGLEKLNRALHVQVGRERIDRALKKRHIHRGAMADYGQAIAIVRRQLERGEKPLFNFMSW